MRQTTSPLNDAETPMQGVRLLLGTIVASQAAMLAIILRASGNTETGPLLAALVWPWLAASAMLGASYLAWRRRAPRARGATEPTVVPIPAPLPQLVGSVRP
jgi:hypothetical protein